MNKKKLGTCVALAATVGVLGVTAYGIEKTDGKATESERVTLQMAADEDDTAAAEETAAEEETTEATEEETTEATEEETTEAQTSGTTADDIDEITVDTNEDSSTSNYGLPNVQQVAEDVMPAIVAITNVSKEQINYFGRTYEADSESLGSGIIVGKSDTELLIATNNHVVEDADELTVAFSVDMDNEDDEDKTLVEAQVKGTDSSNDLAVIAVKLEDIDEEVADKIGIVQLGDSDDLQVGEWVVAIGNSLGYGQSVTAGVVSALDREVTVSTSNGDVTNNMIQTDAAINAGNSGGALLDMEGHLIGINSAKAAANNAEGMGYAIPINTAKSIIEDLMNQETRSKVSDDEAGALGVTVVDVSEEAQTLYKVPAGALVYTLTEESAAKEAGIEEGDIITKLDATTISSRTELLNRMQYYAAGETVTVTVQRSGDSGYEEKTFEVTLGSKSDLEGYTSTSDDSSSDDSSDDDSSDDSIFGGNDEQYEYFDNSGSGLGDLFRSFGY